MDYSFRKATFEDLDFLLKLKKENFKKYINILGSWNDIEQNKKLTEDLTEHLEHKKIILFNDVPIGIYASHITNEGDYYINEISILKGYQGRGIGTNIIKNAMLENANRRIILKVFKENPAKRLYEKFGFRVYQETEEHLKMEKSILNNGSKDMNKNVIVISGGANGLGLELVKESLSRNLYVCNIDRDVSNMQNMNKVYTKNYKGFIGDISDEVFINNTINEISELGNINILINNAGEPSFKMPTLYKKNDIDICFKGLQGMILLSSKVLKATAEENVKIVNIISSAGLKGNKQESVYCATKWGERGYTESLKVAYKGTSVEIVGVYPGGINTNFYKDNRDYVSEEKQATFMNANEVANVILDNILNKSNLTVSDIIIERK